MKPPASLLFLLLLGPALAAGIRALGIFPVNIHSHNIFSQALMTGLADRGHQVTMVSPFPLKSPRPNYTDVDLSDALPSLSGQFSMDMIADTSMPVVHIVPTITMQERFFGDSMCRKVFSHPEFQRLLAGAEREYDVVLTEIFGSDCFAAVAHKLHLPLIGVSSAPDIHAMHDRLGSIDNPSYLHTAFSELADRMSFYERLVNTGEYLVGKYMHKRLMQDKQDAVVREFFGENIPTIAEMVRSTSLVIVNRHVSIHPARPLVPSVVHAGGMHLQPPEPLEEELDAWMHGAEHGVVFFSLGSVMRAASMSTVTRDALLRAFAAIPQRVIWKFESEDLRHVPPNVRISPWLPQRDILAHPKTVLFITHCGLMGTLEALHSGVPLLGMPLFGDQLPNLKLYKSLGIAEYVDLLNFDERAFLDTLKTMTKDNRYLAQAQALSVRFSDRPRGAQEEAVWWVEYVVRHHGALHLRPIGADLSLHEYLLLDVTAVAILVAAVLLSATALAARWAIRLLWNAAQRNAKAKKE